MQTTRSFSSAAARLFLASAALALALSSVRASAALVVRVFPSAPTVPVNVLRVSFAFATRQEPNLLAKISLRYADGSPVGQAFLNQELWTPDDRTLTVLFDPGRVKTGTIAHEKYGYALKIGKVVNVLLDGNVVKSWRVVGEQRIAPDPRRWKIHAPRAGTREPLVIQLGRPIDYMGGNSIVAVSPDEALVAGTAVLGAHETIWTFVSEDVMALRPLSRRRRSASRRSRRQRDRRSVRTPRHSRHRPDGRTAADISRRSGDRGLVCSEGPLPAA